MMRPAFTVFIASIAALALSCSAGSGPRDSGPGGGRDGSAGTDGSTGFDAGGPRIDAGPPRDSGPPFDAGCDLMEPVPTTIVGDPPDMLLVVDISGSMCVPLFGVGFETKLSIMKTALSTLLISKEARINFGLMLYPGSGACGAGTVRNPIAPMNAGPINATLGALNDDFASCAFSNSGATPTHISIDAARTYFSGIPVNPIGRYVLLATDGLPNCGPGIPDGGGTEETVDETVTAIGNLASAGIDTFVLGFGGGFAGGGDALNRMAVAGNTGTPYNASSASDLDMALDTIAAGIIPPSCTVSLGGPTRNPDLFQVRFDGGPLIPRNPARTSGWDYDMATNTVIFYGADCATVQSGSVTNVEVDFGCPGPLI